MKPLKIYMVDNYDSFTFNLVECFKLLGAQLVVYRNDVPISRIDEEAPDLIVISPGPSTPSKAGHLIEVVKRYQGKIPLFGVCLGHQGMIEALGGALGLLGTPVHGKSSPIRHNGAGIFVGLPNPVEVGRYHSLIGTRIPDCLTVTAQTEDGVVMAVSHQTHKLIGVQFHPESILTAKGGHGLLMLENLLKWVRA